MKKIIYILLIGILFSACESAEDTYAEYNTPKHRYVGKCTDLRLEVGWHRFILTWQNTTDAAVDSIIVRWKDQNGLKDSVLLPAGTEKYVTDPIFSNLNYSFTVNARDTRGEESIGESAVYGTPLTADSEILISLQHIERKYYFVGEELILYLQPFKLDSTTYLKSEVTYTSGGEEMKYLLTAEDIEAGIKTLTGVDENTEVSISNTMKVDDYIDTMYLNPYSLDRNFIAMDGTFRANLIRQFKTPNITKEILDTMTVLYADYDINSFEDILYLPKLEKMILGQGRYGTRATNKSKLRDKEVSLDAMDKMHTLNGLEVDLYGSQYNLKNAASFISDKGRANAPTLNFPDTTGWVLSINDTTYYGNENEADDHPFELKNLLVSSYYDDWVSVQLYSKVATHEIEYDMLTAQPIKGFRYTQAMSTTNSSFLTDVIGIYVKDTEDDEWRPAFFQADFQVGDTGGETTDIALPEPLNVRYIKLVIKDVVTSKNNAVAVNFFSPYI